MYVINVNISGPTAVADSFNFKLSSTCAIPFIERIKGIAHSPENFLPFVTAVEIKFM